MRRRRSLARREAKGLVIVQGHSAALSPPVEAAPRPGRASLASCSACVHDPVRPVDDMRRAHVPCARAPAFTPSPVELRHLRYLIAVAEAGTIGGAARRLFVAQQAVSRQLRDLERELGVQLLVRSPDGVALTPAGETLVARARASLASLDETVATLRAAAGRAPIVVTVGTVELGLRSGIVTAALRRLGASGGLASGRTPQLDIRLLQLASLSQWAALRDRAIDLGVLSTPPPHDHADLASMPLADDPLTTAYVPAQWRIGVAASDRGGTGIRTRHAARATPQGDDSPAHAGAPASLAVADLAALPLIVFPRHVNPAFHERLDAALATIGAPALTRREASDGPAAWTMVAAGLGWTLEPRSCADGAVAPPAGVRAVPLRDLVVPFGLHLAWRRGDTRPVVERLRRALEGAAAPAIEAGDAVERRTGQGVTPILHLRRS